MFLRRLGPEKQLCAGGHSCPDFLLLETGDVAVIGADITEEAAGRFPQGSGCGPGERVVRVPKSVIAAAIPHIVQAL